MAKAHKDEWLPDTTRVLSERQIDLYRAAIKRLYGGSPFEYYRAHLLVALVLYMGLDLHEVRGMQVRDLTANGIWLYYKDRSIPYSAASRQLAKLYLAYRATRAAPDQETLLIGRSAPMSTAAMRRVLNEVAVESHVRADATILRDTFAYNLALDGAPVPVIAALRGCSTDEATKFILLASGDDDVTSIYMRSVERRMRPVSKKVKRVT